MTNRPLLLSALALLLVSPAFLAAQPFGRGPADLPESWLMGGAIQEKKDKTARAHSETNVLPGDPGFTIVQVPLSHIRLLESPFKQRQDVHRRVLLGYELHYQRYSLYWRLGS